jgi:hypothetical protein
MICAGKPDGHEYQQDCESFEETGAHFMEQLRCVVERITYQNPQNGYSVIKCRAKGYSDLVTDKMNYRVVLKTQDVDMLERGLV